MGLAERARGQPRAGRGDAAESPWRVRAIEPDEPEAAAPPAAAPSPSPSRVVGASPPTSVTPTTISRPEAKHRFAWLGAHGGAGATSLARSSGQGGDLTRQWPSPALGWPAEVAIVCRYNAAGLEAAAVLIRESASGTVPEATVVALAVVADSPERPSKEVRRRLHELAAAVSAVIHIPWIRAWRDQPYTPQPAATKAAATVEALSTTPSTPPTSGKRT